MESPVTIINGNQYNFGDINGGTLNLGNNPKKERKFGVTIPENLVPRRDMLDRLGNEFESHNCVVVSGIGGSGKTSLAYLYAKEKEFNNIIWITVNGKIEDVFVDRIAGLLFKEDYEKFSKIEDKQTKLNIIKNELSNIAGNNLLVLDINSNDDETKQEIESDLYKYLPANYWKTLVLTRTKAINTKRFITVDMTQMTDSEAFDLFKSNFQRNIQFSDTQLADIAKELLYHPLLIEQTAIYFTKGNEKTADEIIDKIKDNKVSNERTQDILKGLVAEGKEDQDIYTYLINLCNIKNLSDEEKNFLAVYVTWPTEPINKETIDTLMPGYDKMLPKKENFIIKIINQIFKKHNNKKTLAPLSSLVEKGILSRNSAEQYIIHSLIADVLREQIEIENHDYSEYFGNIKNELDDETKRMLLHKYSKCIASSFINYGICKDKDIVLFRDFLLQLLNNGDPILYNLPEPKYSDLIKKLANNAESYQAAQLYNAAAWVEYVRYHLQEAKSLYEKGLEVMEGLEENPDILYLKGGLLNNLAMLEEKLGDLDAAKEHYQEAIEIMRNLPESPDNRKNLATHLNNLANLEQQKLGDIDSAKEHYKEAIEIMRNLPESPENRKYLANHLNNLANLEKKLSELDAAKEHYKEAIELDRKLPESPENRKQLANHLNNLAGLEAQKLGELDAAKEHYKEAIEIMRNLPESPENRKYLAGSLNNLAGLEEKLGDLDAAKEHFKEATEIMRNLPESPENRKSLASHLNNLAMLEQQKLGDLDAAKEHYQEAIEIDRNLPESPENRKNLATDLNNLAMLEKKLGELDAAKEHYKEAIEIDRNLPESPENRKSLARDLNNFAALEAQKLGDINSAKEHLKEAIEIMRKLPESLENLNNMANILTGLGMVDANLGNLDAAKEHYKEVLEIAKQIQNEKSIKIIEDQLSQLPS